MSKSMRNLLALLLVFVVIGLIGCSSDTSSENGAEAGDEDTGEESADEGSLEGSDDISYPEDTMTLVVPFNAGGGADTAARQFAPYMEEELGVTFNVENRPGAGTQVANNSLLTGDNEGYELLNLHQPHMSFTIHNQGAEYSLDDFAMVNFHVVDPGAMSVLTESEFETISDLVDKIKENPGEIAIGTVQSSGPHVLLYWMQENMDLDFIIVPYDGGAPGRTALLGEEIDAYFGYAVGNLVMKDQTKTIGVSWSEPHSTWPDAPTFSDNLGLEVPNVASYRGIAFPKEFKEQYPERFDKFAETYETAFNNEEFQTEYENTGLNFSTPEEAEEMLKEVDELIAEYGHLLQ